MSEVSHDDATERALLGGLCLYPARLDDVCPELQPAHFYRPAHGVLFLALKQVVDERLEVDTLVLLDRCKRIDRQFPDDCLVSCMADALTPRREHAEIILRHAASREVLATMTKAMAALRDGDPYGIAAETAKKLDNVGAPTDDAEALTLPELIGRAETSAPWVIPGLLRSDWRAILVGAEGSGKSVLLRQLAACAAQGIHPLKFIDIPPVRTLSIDAENSLAAIAESGEQLDTTLRNAAKGTYDADRYRIWSRPGGLDLRSPGDRAALMRELRSHQPQLVCAGPVYKLGLRRPNESYEEAAEGVQRVLDELRTRFGFALVLEHHAAKGYQGSREMAPFGSQRWLAWPELGIGLRRSAEDGSLTLARFRGDRMKTDWPDRLTRGKTFAWEGVWHGGLRVA